MPQLIYHSRFGVVDIKLCSRCPLGLVGIEDGCAGVANVTII